MYATIFSFCYNHIRDFGIWLKSRQNSRCITMGSSAHIIVVVQFGIYDTIFEVFSFIKSH